MRLFLVPLALICLLWPYSRAAAMESFTLKFSIFLPVSHFAYQRVLAPFARRIEVETKGAVQVRLFPSGSLEKDPRKQFALVKHGDADLALVVPEFSNDLKAFPGVQLARVPGLVPNALKGSLAMWKTHESLGLLEADGVRVISVFLNPPEIIHSAREITSLEDLKGLKLRVGSSQTAEMLGQLGAVPIPSSLPETYYALQRGSFDGVVATWETAGAFKLGEVTKSHYDYPFGAATVAIVMNSDMLNKLPPDFREIVKREGGERLAEQWGTAFDELNAQWKKKVGGPIVEPNDQARASDAKSMKDLLSRIGSQGGELQDRFAKKFQDYLD